MLRIDNRERKLREKALQRQIDRQAEAFYVSSQWQLIRIRFARNRLALVGLVVLSAIYLMAIFCEFLAPYDPNGMDSKRTNLPPQGIHFYSEKTGFSIRPFIFGLKEGYDKVTLKAQYEIDTEQINYIKLFTHGDAYKMWGLFNTDIHLFSTDGEKVYLFGTDRMGRDLFSRIVYGSRISSSIGLIGVFMSFILGILIGGISGYFGGKVDVVIQRVIDFIISLPTLPIWMALSAALPATGRSSKLILALSSSSRW